MWTSPLLQIFCWSLCMAWDYSSLGTDWASDSAFPNCAGERQSPINIISNDVTPTNDLPVLRKTCGKIEGKLKNDGGHFLKFETLDGTPWVSQNEYLSGGPFGTDKYHFWHFNLHWGSSECDGSEHTIDGHRFPAELQLVHVKENYIYIDGTIDERAFTSGDGLAVLSVFVKGGASANTTFYSQWFQPIAEAVKEIADSGLYSTIVQPKTIDLNQLAQRINPTFSGDFNYWTYNGSLTTPTCDESVVFIVAEKAIEVMDEQLAELFELTTDDNTEKLANNFRLTQPLNSRDVLYVSFNDDTVSDYEATCTCNLFGTVDYDCTCDSSDGQCNCNSANGYTGIDCDECISPFVWDSNTRTCMTCEPGYYFTSGACSECNCNTYGTVDCSSSCADNTGLCTCDSSRYSGDKCDESISGFSMNSDMISNECFTVTCSMTVDNILTSGFYNGNTLEITGTLTNWRSEKTFQFESCDRSNPGSLTFLGSDSESSGDFCKISGLILQCTSVDTFSPWHNFVTDMTNWKTSDGSEVCSNPTAAFINAANNQNIGFIVDIVAAGAVAVWENSEAMDAEMVGTPPFCEVICTFVVDSQVTGVYHSGQQLAIVGPKDDVSMAKTVNFTSCDRLNPGELIIHGSHDGSGDNCVDGGLLLHCSANDPQSPWNNFVSDSDNWVDGEDDSTAACQDDGTSGFLGSTSSDIDDLVEKGAKKIWVDKVDVQLKGTPPFCPVSCSMTIDNIVNSVCYGDMFLMVEGDLMDWESEKTFEFSSCDNANPGYLVINGTEQANSGPFCTKAGMILHCTAEDTTSPWHNFVSDNTNWSSNDDEPICIPDPVAFVTIGQGRHQWLKDIVDAGAGPIWVEAKEVSLVGTPPSANSKG